MLKPSLETIDVETARILLSNAIHKKPRRPSVVKKYVEDMRNDDWRETGEPILIDENGRLIDGYHRLSAQVTVGITMEWVVIRGVPKDAVDAINIGAIRTVGEIIQLKHSREQNTNALAAAAGWAWRYSNGLMLNGWSSMPSKADHLRLIERLRSTLRPHIVATKAMFDKSEWKGAPPSLIAFLLWKFSEVGGETRAENFLLSLVRGVDVKPDSVLDKLRTFLGARKALSLHKGHVAYAIVTAWNSCAPGSKLKRGGLVYKGGEFPEIL